MHRLVVPSRSVLKICKRHRDTSPPRKSRRTTCCYVSESSNTRRPQKKVNRKPKKKVLHEFSENESSKGNIEENKKHESIPSSLSTDSVIYVGTMNANDSNSNNIPVVDLTNSSDNLSCSERIAYSKSLKTIYFSSKNFERDTTLRKNLVTTSLINLPVIRKPIVQRRLCSATVNNKKNNQRLALLNLPDQYLDSSDFFCEDNVLSKAALTESDEKIIDWILEQDNSSASKDFSSLDTGFDSIPELCKKYGVESYSNFD